MIDRHSSDGTAEIARRFGAEILLESQGLGRARNIGLQASRTDAVLFLDSDVEILRADFLPQAWSEYCKPRTAAVVGVPVGHAFHYGLPLRADLDRTKLGFVPRESPTTPEGERPTTCSAPPDGVAFTSATFPKP